MQSSAVERMQMRATKLIKSISNICYDERLRKLKFTSLKHRRIRGDVIEAFDCFSLFVCFIA